MKNKKPLVSIITPSYNQGRYIEETILSVIKQDYEHIEYIVIDGGSTDNSPAIIEEYKDHLTYHVSEKDNGQSDAINKGFRRATGDIIAWLNSDDVYTENAISQAVEALHANPDCGFVFGNVLSMDMDSNVFNTMTFGDWGLQDLMRFKIISQPGIFMRKSALDAVGYLNPDYHYLMDHHLWLKIAAEYPVKYVNAYWAAARYHPEAKNLTGGAHYGNEAFVLYDWMHTQPVMQEILASDDRLVRAGAHHLRARYLLDSGEDWKAFGSYVKAVLGDPRILQQEYRRIAFALVNSLVPAGNLRKKFINRRTQAVKNEEYDRLLRFINE